MTVSSSVNKVIYSGNSATVLFPVNYYFLENSHLKVILRAADGTETVQALTTNYTVTGAGNPAGGSITMFIAPLIGTTLTILRNVPATQETDYLANDPFPAESHERALDKLTMLTQENEEIASRSIQIPQTDPVSTNIIVPKISDRASRLLGFGSTGSVAVSGSTIAQVDAAVATITSIASAPSGNSAGISHIAAGFGAVTTTVQAKLRQTVSVKDFGAVGDGVADDAAAIQAAIDAVGNNATVYFPNGIYAVGSAGVDILNKTNLVLASDSAVIKLIAISSLSIPSLGICSFRFTGCTQSGLKGLTINGNTIASAAVGFSAGVECFVDGCTIYESGAGIGQVLSSNGGQRNRFTNNLVYSGNFETRGIWAGNVTGNNMETDVYISGNIVRGNSGSGIIASTVGGSVIGNYLLSNEGSGIVIPANVGNLETRDLVVDGNYCEDNLFHGIQSDCISGSVSRNCTITGNVCINHTRTGPGASAGIFVTRVDGWSVVGNVCCDNSNAGVYVDLANNVTVSGNTLNDTRAGIARTQNYGVSIVAQTGNVSNVSVSGNVCNNNLKYGVQLVNSGVLTATNIAICNNVTTANSEYGIFAAEVALGDITAVVANGNICTGNGITDFRLSFRDVVINANKYATSLDVELFNFADGDTSPSVVGRTYWRANNTASTSITTFDDGARGQQIVIRAANGNTTVVNGATVINKGGINVVIPSNGIISYVLQGTVWFEAFRSF
jgi:hypothetical protein